RLPLLLVALPYAGARRLEHLQYLVGDPLVRRFAGLARVPTARTMSNWLRRAQPAIAAPSLPRLVLPGAFVVPGTKAGPAGQVAVTGELTHVHSELGDQNLGGAPGDAVNGIQARQFIRERADDLLDALT